MGKPTNHINKDFGNIKIRRDSSAGRHSAWRLCTPTGEKQYRTQEEAIQARLDYINAVSFFDKFLIELKPTEYTRIRRYEAVRNG